MTKHFDSPSVRNAIRFAHLAVVIPVWGIIVAAICYKYIADHSPEKKNSVTEAVVWQVALAVFHFFCLFALLIGMLVSKSLVEIPTVYGIAVTVVWATGYLLAIVAAFTAAEIELDGNHYRYPVVSSFVRQRRLKPPKREGSVFYPFEDPLAWK